VAVSFGVSPIGWTNDDWPELGRDIPLEVCLREAREAGYEGIELGGKFPRRADALRPLLARHNLRLISGWYGARLQARPVPDELTLMRDHLDLLAAMGCAVVVFAEVEGAVHGARRTPLSRRPRLGDGAWAGFGDRLTAVAEHVASRGLRLAYHPHMGTVVETEREIDRLMAATGEAVGLLVDTGHLAYAGADPVAVARRHARRIVHVHAKDVRPGVLAKVLTRDPGFLDAVVAGVFTVPGDGALDYGGLFGVLGDARYAGWIVVEAEQDPAVAPPLTYARRGLAHVMRAARAAGLTPASAPAEARADRPRVH
jgi:inosose dehydratase